MSLRIVVVLPSFHPIIGGVEIYGLNFCKELVHNGHEVYVLTPDRIMGRRLAPSNEKIDGINVYRIKTLFDLSYRIKLWPSLKGKIKEIAPDIVHVYSHDSYSWLALSACRESRIPLLLTTYGPFNSQNERNRISTLALTAYDTYVAPRILRNATRVNVRYPELIEWLLKIGVGREMVSLEPSCITPEYLLEGDGEQFKESLGLTTAKIILYLGRITRQKGVHNLIKAAELVHKDIPGIELVLMGQRDTHFELGDLPSWIHIVPPTTSAREERNAIAAADLFVMPSRFEGFSQAVLKALAQGKRVIVTSVGGLPFEVDYGKYGKLVQYGAIESLGKAMVEHFRNPPHLDVGEIKKYASKFTYKENTKRIQSQYLEILNH